MVKAVLWVGLCLLALTTAGPLDRFPRDVSEDYQSIDLSAYANYTANEVCFSDNEVFQKGDLMPNPGPCEECRCEPPSIVCQMVKCPVNNNGCRTIQRPNHCCPDYNCECDYNGQLYSDGERLDLPDQPCQVCYCKGGEVMCTSLTCYTRSDCEPQHVPGQCCPKYTNCPLRDMAATNTDDKSIQTRSTNKTAHSPKREMQPWLLTNSAMQTSSPPATKRPEEVTNGNGLVIIVSDWLTERKTTPESSAQGQSLQDVTKLGEPLILSTEKTEQTTRSDNSSTKRAHDIVSPPLDEVIFTRIDSLNIQEKNIASSTHFVSNLLEDLETTNIPTKIPSNNKLIHEKTESESSWSTILPISTTTSNIKLYTQDKNLVSEEYNTEEPPNHSGSVKVESTTKPEFTTPKEVTDTDSQTPDMRVVENIDREESILKYDKKKPTQKPIKQEIDEVIKLKESSRTVNDSSMMGNKNDKADGIIENKNNIVSSNVFELEPTNGSKLSTPISILQGETDKDIYFTTIEHDTPVTNSIESATDEMYLTSNFQNELLNKELSPINNREENLNLRSIGIQIPGEENHSMYETTETLSNDMAQTTTPYFIEDHMFGLDTEQNWHYGGFKAVEQLTIFSTQESSTDSVNTEIASYKEEQQYNNLFKEPLLTDNRTSNYVVKEVDESGEIFKKAHEVSGKPNDSIVVLSSEQAQFDIQEISADENHEVTEFPITYTVNEIITNSERAPSNKLSISNAQSYNKTKNADDEIESITVAGFKLGESQERSPSISNVPPVLELNSHVPFLLLGGSDNSDASDSLEDTEIVTTTDQSKELTSTEHTVTLNNVDSTTIIIDDNSLNDESLVDKLALQSQKTKSSASTVLDSTTVSNADVQPTVTSSHIPLTPGDLKILAEYLIKEKIKPVEASNNATYSQNQWLQGNLTSEDKIASIMAAANVSVGIMNQTLKGIAVSISTKVKNNEKKDKESSSKGHSLTVDEHKKLSSEVNTYDKLNSKDVSPSQNELPGIFMNDGLTVRGSTDPTQDILTFSPKELTTTKQAIDSIRLDNPSNDASIGETTIENNSKLGNRTNNLRPSSQTISETLSSSNYSTEGSITTPNDKYFSNDIKSLTIDDVEKHNSTNIDETNLRDDHNKNTDDSSPDVSHHKTEKAPTIPQKIAPVP